MGNLIRHPAYKYVRDFQTFNLTGGVMLSGQKINYTGTLPFRFIVTKLAATCVKIQTNPLLPTSPDSVGFLDNPPVTTVLKYHQTPLDNQPIPLRSAWGTARRPTILPIPWAVEQGTNLTVECVALFANSGIVVSTVGLQLGFILIGYQPSDEEFEAIKKYNDANFVRPYQTFTMAASGGKPYLDFGDKTASRDWRTDFPLDFFATKAVGQVFDLTGGNEVDSFIPAVEEPSIPVQMRTKSALVNASEDLFRAYFGDAKFPAPLTPSWQFKQGDVLTMALRNRQAITQFGIYPSLVGYAPMPSVIRAGDIERGRTKPEAFIEQSMAKGLPASMIKGR